MTNTEFASIIAYITSATGKALSADGQVVYFELLGDLPADVGWLAAKRVLLEHRWATFPTVAELRQAAVESSRGEVKELSGAEAWALAWRAVGRIDLDVDRSKERAMKDLPAVVAESMNAMGLANLIGGDDPVGVVRGQFLKVFEQLQARDRRAALLPPAVHEAIIERRETIRETTRPAIIDRLADSFAMPE